MTEYLAENARLRQLSRRLSEGQVSAGDYRAARREIIAALEEGRRTGSMPDEAPEPVADLSPSDAGQTLARPPEDAGVFLKTMPPSRREAPPAPAEELDAVPLLAEGTGVARTPGWDTHTRVLAVVLGISLLLAVSALVYVFAL